MPIALTLSLLLTFSLDGFRFHAIEVLNAGEKRARVGRGAITITYMVQREGLSGPIGLVSLSDPWSDGLFYFKAPQFLRSGKYTVSFFVEGKQGAQIAPLVFPVTVHSRAMRCGTSNALERLVCLEWLHSEGRRVLPLSRRAYVEKAMGTCNTDLDAVKAALLTLFCALPQGCLQTAEAEDEPLYASTGWSDSLELSWLDAVEAASHPTELVECVLLLEQHITRAWYLPAAQAGFLQNALPSAHFGLRLASLSSAALRIYILDRVVDFSRVVIESRKRGKGALIGDGTRASGRKKRKSYAEVEDDGDETQSE